MIFHNEMGVLEFYRYTHFYLMLFIFDDNTCPQFNYKRVYKIKIYLW